MEHTQREQQTGTGRQDRLEGGIQQRSSKTVLGRPGTAQNREPRRMHSITDSKTWYAHRVLTVGTDPRSHARLESSQSWPRARLQGTCRGTGP